MTQGHYRDKAVKIAEVWGCAVHPSQNLFASAGADRTVMVWSPTKMIVQSEQFKQDICAIDWSQDGKFIVAGDRVGAIYLLDAKTLEVLGTEAAGNKGWIEDIKFSPNSKLVAFGTH